MPRIWSIVNFMGVQQGHHRYSQGLDASLGTGPLPTPYGCPSASSQHPHYECTGDTTLLHQAIWIYKLAYDIAVSHLLSHQFHTVNFMGTHKVIIDIHSVLVPVRHQATVHTLCGWSCARLQHPCCKCTGDTAVQP